MTTTPPKTVIERVDELTGTDELAILDHFDHDVWDTYDHAIDPLRPTSRKISGRLGRMLVFAEKIHDGIPPKVAFDSVMKMTVSQVNEFLRFAELYADDTTEDDGEKKADDAAQTSDQAETAAGKDGSADD